MILTIDPYDLPDADLVRPSSAGGRCCVYVPPRTLIVVGKGSDPEKELIRENIIADGVPVLRRATGGAAVLLSPDMVVVALALYGEQQRRSAEYFHRFNELIIAALGDQGIMGAESAGTSDIALRDRKIAGTALYRNRHLVFYHAVINAAGDVNLMERYLKLPPRVPVYRRGRSHREFVTSLAAEGFALNVSDFTESVETRFHGLLAQRFESAALIAS